MANLLKQLELDELSLVDRPANAQAMVSLFKRDNSQEDEAEMTEETQATEVDTLKADIERLQEENERLRKGLIENGFVIKAEAIEKKAEVETIEVGGEMIVKSDIPAPVLKALEEANKAAEAAAIEKADVALTKRAEAELPHFDVIAAKALVEKFAENENVMATLKAADKAFEAAMVEVGKSDADGEFATAKDKMEAMVSKYMQENNFKKSEYAKAYAAVAKTAEGKALITKTYKGE